MKTYAGDKVHLREARVLANRVLFWINKKILAFNPWRLGQVALRRESILVIKLSPEIFVHVQIHNLFSFGISIRVTDSIETKWFPHIFRKVKSVNFISSMSLMMVGCLLPSMSIISYKHLLYLLSIIKPVAKLYVEIFWSMPSYKWQQRHSTLSLSEVIAELEELNLETLSKNFLTLKK